MGRPPAGSSASLVSPARVRHGPGLPSTSPQGLFHGDPYCVELVVTGDLLVEFPAAVVLEDDEIPYMS